MNSQESHRPMFVCTHCGAKHPNPEKECWLCGRPLSTVTKQESISNGGRVTPPPALVPTTPSKMPARSVEDFNVVAWIVLTLFGLIFSGTWSRSHPIAFLLLILLFPIISSVLPAKEKSEQEPPLEPKEAAPDALPEGAAIEQKPLSPPSDNTLLESVLKILSGIAVVIGVCALLGFIALAVLFITCMTPPY